jgi:hypothetical protein
MRTTRPLERDHLQLVAVAVDVRGPGDDGRVADVNVVLVVITSEARYPTGQTAPDQIGCGPAIAVDAPLVADLSGWRPCPCLT